MVIYIPEKPLRDQPLKRIPKFFHHEKIKYKFVKDMGSITKMWYAVQEYPDHNIAVVDDDIIVAKDWLQTLDDNFNNDVVICYRGRNFIKPNLNYKLTKLIESHKITKTQRVDIMTGTSGWMCTSKMFDKHFFEKYDRNSYFSRIDDIYLSAHFHRKKIPIIVIPYENKPKPTSASKVNSLWETNQTGIRNDKGINHFKKYFKK